MLQNTDRNPAQKSYLTISVSFSFARLLFTQLLWGRRSQRSLYFPRNSRKQNLHNAVQVQSSWTVSKVRIWYGDWAILGWNKLRELWHKIYHNKQSSQIKSGKFPLHLLPSENLCSILACLSFITDRLYGRNWFTSRRYQKSNRSFTWFLDKFKL